jgi:hypothetical protein
MRILGDEPGDLLEAGARISFAPLKGDSGSTMQRYGRPGGKFEGFVESL